MEKSKSFKSGYRFGFGVIIGICAAAILIACALMIEKIQQTNTFQSLEPMSQQLVIKRVNRLQIEDAIIQARTMGVDAWSAQTGLQERWKNIVKDVIRNEQSS